MIGSGDMHSQARRDRALRRGPGAWGFLLAHHWPDQLDRCYRVWIGQRPVWFCARCCGVYPSLFALLALLLFLDVPRGWWDVLWLLALPIPALVDWSLARLSLRPGSNRGRTFWGAFLGLSLGRMIHLNMIEPFNTLVVFQLAGLAGIALLVESARPYFARRREARS